MQPDTLEFEEVLVRRLRPEDLEPVIRLDAKIVGRSRSEYFKLKLQQNLQETGIKVSLAAELEGCFVGFLLARVYYGEFGTMEPAATLDTIGVDPGFRRRGVGTALIEQLARDLRALGVEHVRTEVSWRDLELACFLRDEGFVPAPRISLDLDLTRRA